MKLNGFQSAAIHLFLIDVHSQDSSHLSAFDVVESLLIFSIDADGVYEGSLSVRPKQATVLECQRVGRVGDPFQNDAPFGAQKRDDVDAALNGGRQNVKRL